jgi:hypothetical protein
VRLDHLLSKEHLAIDLWSVVQSHASDERSGDGARGWNIDQLAGHRGRTASTAACSRNVGRATEDCFGTLLSPEGPGIAPITRTSRRRCCASRVDGAVAVEWDRSTAEPPGASRQATDEDLARPYLENCTVDASIFVAKLIRAHGGCLGTRSR